MPLHNQKQYHIQSGCRGKELKVVAGRNKDICRFLSNSEMASRKKIATYFPLYIKLVILEK